MRPPASPHKKKPLPAAAAVLLTLLLLPIGRTAGARGVETAAGPTLPHPILFVTQIPWPYGFSNINDTFGNHLGSMDAVPRGGDLWIRYPDGTLKNLTAAAGLGSNGFQGASAIAVRDPSVHWDGNKALFSMLTGAPTAQYQPGTWTWQMYELSGLGQNQTPSIVKVANQPAGFNNITPIYGSDDRIIFTSDRPRSGELHLYPQRDEYELAPTVSGLWSLDPASGQLKLLDHAPSGDFTPIVDSFGRIVFTRWDHLQRDQQADGDSGGGCGNGNYGTFNYSDESAAAAMLNDRSEVFPEPRSCRADLLAGTNLVGHTFNQFFPWMVNQDGTELETLNHIGRHEVQDYLDRSLNDDPNVDYFYGPGQRANQNVVSNMFQLKEYPTAPGYYIAVDAPEFSTHASGQLLRIAGAPGLDADAMVVTYLTHRDTASYSDAPSIHHSGHYRDPLVLADGTLVAAHTANTQADQNIGSTATPLSRKDYRIKTLSLGGNGHYGPGALLTAGIVESSTWWTPDVLASFSGTMWELQPVEVRARPRPAKPGPTLEAPEAQAFSEAGVVPADLQAWLMQQELALIVSRDVTTRDDQDRQQPFNLRVQNGVAQTLGAPGKIYDVAHLQLFQADQLRGWYGCCSPTPNPGRRVLARELHDPAAAAANPPNPGAPAGAVKLESDGSYAAFVPARRAMTWQLTDQAGTGVVRERYWLTFQPGEVRVCASCHGVNKLDQAGQAAPQNKPEALVKLLQHWKTIASSTPATFADVTGAYWARKYIEGIHDAGITGGCASTPQKLYCPESSVRRAEMVVFLLRALHGSSFAPPDLPDTQFSDVAGSYWAADWIQQAAAEGLTGGCGNGEFCPEAAVTRAQMAIFLLRAIHGGGYVPPPPSGGKFNDVPAGHWAAGWIEQLATEGITGGCSSVAFCPDALVTRAQMAVFLVRAFAIPTK